MISYSCGLVTNSNFTLFNKTGKTKKELQDEFLAEEESLVLKIKQMEQKGLWGKPTLSRKISEPIRKQTHWDFLLKEMQWMHNDFVQERKWKISISSYVATECLKHHYCEQSVYEERILAVEKKKLAKEISQHVMDDFWIKEQGNVLLSQKNGNSGKLSQSVNGRVDNSVNVSVRKKIVKVSMTPSQKEAYRNLIEDSNSVRAISSRDPIEILGFVNNVRVLSSFGRIECTLDEPNAKRIKIEDCGTQLSGKMVEFESLLKTLRSQRVLVITSMSRCRDEISTFLSARSIAFVSLDGTASDRAVNINRFNDDNSIQICLVSRKGLNGICKLQRLSLVLLYDMDWNPFVRDAIYLRISQLGQVPVIQFSIPEIFVPNLNGVGVPIDNFDVKSLLGNDGKPADKKVLDETLSLYEDPADSFSQRYYEREAERLEKCTDTLPIVVYARSVLQRNLIEPEKPGDVVNHMEELKEIIQIPKIMLDAEQIQRINEPLFHLYYYTDKDELLQSARIVIDGTVKEIYTELFKKKKKRNEPTVTPPLGDLVWKPNEDEALFRTSTEYSAKYKGVEVPTNWDFVEDRVRSTVFPSPTPRTPNQCRVRMDVLKVNEPHLAFENLNSVSFDMRKTNLNRITNLWTRKTYEPRKILSRGPILKLENVKNEKSPIDYMKILENPKSILESQNIISKLPLRLQTVVPAGIIHEDKKLTNNHIFPRAVSPLLKYVELLNLQSTSSPQVLEQVRMIMNRGDISESEKYESIRSLVGINKF